MAFAKKYLQIQWKNEKSVSICHCNRLSSIKMSGMRSWSSHMASHESLTLTQWCVETMLSERSDKGVGHIFSNQTPAPSGILNCRVLEIYIFKSLVKLQDSSCYMKLFKSLHECVVSYFDELLISQVKVTSDEHTWNVWCPYQYRSAHSYSKKSFLLSCADGVYVCITVYVVKPMMSPLSCKIKYE